MMIYVCFSNKSTSTSISLLVSWLAMSHTLFIFTFSVPYTILNYKLATRTTNALMDNLLSKVTYLAHHMHSS